MLIQKKLNTILFLFALSLPALAVYKFNETGNSHVVDGNLLVDQIFSDNIDLSSAANGVSQSTFISGDGSALTGVSVSANGWLKSGNLVKTDNVSSNVVIGDGPLGGANDKLLVYGDMNIINGDLLVAPTTQADQDTGIIAGTPANEISSEISFIDGQARIVSTHDLRFNTGGSFGDKVRWVKESGTGPVTLMELGGRGLAINKTGADVALDVNGNIGVAGNGHYIGNGSKLTNLNIPKVLGFNPSLVCKNETLPGTSSNPRCGFNSGRCVSTFIEENTGAFTPPRKFIPCNTTQANVLTYFLRCCKIQ